MSLSYPAAGTTLLSGICRDHGFKSCVKDLNYELFNHCGADIYNELTSYLTLAGELSENIKGSYEKFIHDQIEYINQLNVKFVGISVFTFECQKFTKDFCTALRKSKFKGKIIIGGAGLSTTGIATKMSNFGDSMIAEGLVDFYIRGEADEVILSVLRNEYKQLDNHVYQIDDLEKISLPDYTGVVHNNYIWPNSTPTLPITGSRGCVRFCTFCDIHKFWPSFKFRSGYSIAKEMIAIYKTTGVKNFVFTDSLINGSIKSFRELCHTLTEYYRDNNLPDRYFTWSGQFICRDSQSFKERDFELAAQAGMTGVAIGVESGSDRVREHMKKKFTNKDLDFTLSCLEKFGINCYFLMIVGYPTETNDDFQDTVDMFYRYEKYAINGTILGVNLGGTLSLDAGTDLTENAKDLGIHGLTASSESLFGLNWHSDKNPQLTFEERIRRRLVLQELLMDLGYTVWNGDHQLKRLMNSYKKIKNGTY